MYVCLSICPLNHLFIHLSPLPSSFFAPIRPPTHLSVYLSAPVHLFLFLFFLYLVICVSSYLFLLLFMSFFHFSLFLFVSLRLFLFFPSFLLSFYIHLFFFLSFNLHGVKPTTGPQNWGREAKYGDEWNDPTHPCPKRDLSPLSKLSVTA
jgi:hypothetical protein